MNRIIACTLAAILASFSINAQEKKDTIARATELSIPTSGAFTLLGGKPTEITTPGFTKDIKLDYFITKFSLNPNIAFDFQPVWLLGFKNTSANEYNNKSALLRFLSTTNVSIGTKTDNDSVHHFAASVKFSFHKDPMADDSYLASLDHIQDSLLKVDSIQSLDITKRKIRLKKLKVKLENIVRNERLDEMKLGDLPQIRLDTLLRLAPDFIEENKNTTFARAIERADTTMKMLDGMQDALTSTRQVSLTKAVKDHANAYIERNIHAPRMDIGIGRLATYQDPELYRLGMKADGFGVWVNPAFGFVPGQAFHPERDVAQQDKILISALYKYIKVDTATQQFAGANVKYHSRNLELFAEYAYSSNTGLTLHTVAYGGTFKIGSTKLVEFGIRTSYTEQLKFYALRPVIAFNWKLMQDPLK